MQTAAGSASTETGALKVRASDIIAAGNARAVHPYIWQNTLPYVSLLRKVAHNGKEAGCTEILSACAIPTVFRLLKICVDEKRPGWPVHVLPGVVACLVALARHGSAAVKTAMLHGANHMDLLEQSSRVGSCARDAAETLTRLREFAAQPEGMVAPAALAAVEPDQDAGLEAVTIYRLQCLADTHVLLNMFALRQAWTTTSFKLTAWNSQSIQLMPETTCLTPKSQRFFRFEVLSHITWQ